MLNDVGSKVSVSALHRKSATCNIIIQEVGKLQIFSQAQEQKDVYETDDVEPSPSDYYEEETENESIDKTKLNTSDAYNKFKGKYLIGNVDFSDNIGRRKCIGYNAV